MYNIVFIGNSDVSAAIVPFCACRPLAVCPTFLGLPRLGPLAITAEPNPNILRFQLQHLPQLQYPVVFKNITVARLFAGGISLFDEHPALKSKLNATISCTPIARMVFSLPLML